jgi:hypothetical protein
VPELAEKADRTGDLTWTITLKPGRAFSDGTPVTAAALAAPFEMTNRVPGQLGLEFEQGPIGSVIKTDAMKETSMAGVFACGDAARPMASVPLAVGDGNLAGAGLHRSLMFSRIWDGARSITALMGSEPTARLLRKLSY